jgi:hypothetical protein
VGERKGIDMKLEEIRKIQEERQRKIDILRESAKNLNLSPSERKERIRVMKSAQENLSLALMVLSQDCPHIILEKQPEDFGGWPDYGAAECDICGQSFGWYCPDSPDRYCHYKVGENCIYCGDPDERK